MLATFVIGLREGLEAALIVGIIAAFLRKNGRGLAAMWLGVGLALLLSIAVGVGLSLVEQALPQARQEAMESVIGVIAVFFVTGMIAWMSSHARGLRRELEAEAAAALGRAGVYALASMAFLAVLREGFETSVFLLATFSAAQSAGLAAAGAVIGLLLAVAIGWGIYAGGVSIHLGRFFRVTGAFLILVAAGLVVTSLRTAHEAGWLNAGQQHTVDLAWLVAPGTVRSALITGVLGIPADPRLVEVIGWLAYIVPVALFVYWPAARRPSARAALRLRLAVAGALSVAGLGLAVFFPLPRIAVPDAAPVVAAADEARPIGSVALIESRGQPPALKISLSGSAERTLPLADSSRRTEEHKGIDASAWTIETQETPAGAPAVLSIEEIIALSGGRVPLGLGRGAHPGPFDAAWSVRRSTHVWAADGGLLDAVERSVTLVRLSGGGLTTPRTISVSGAGDEAPGGWQASAAYRDAAITAAGRFAAAEAERRFWAVYLPVALVLAAFLIAASAARLAQRSRVAAASSSSSQALPAGDDARNPVTKGVAHAAH